MEWHFTWETCCVPVIADESVDNEFDDPGFDRWSPFYGMGE
jgi:hypothetical protein